MAFTDRELGDTEQLPVEPTIRWTGKRNPETGKPIFRLFQNTAEWQTPVAPP